MKKVDNAIGQDEYVDGYTNENVSSSSLVQLGGQ
jgi:hypothetical protein